MVQAIASKERGWNRLMAGSNDTNLKFLLVQKTTRKEQHQQ